MRDQSEREMAGLLGDSERSKKKRRRRLCWCSLVVVLSLAGCFVLVLAMCVGLQTFLDRLPDGNVERAAALLDRYPVIDGHNDLAEQLRSLFENQLDRIDLRVNSSGKYGVMWQTDIPRLRAGKVGAQFWSAYMSCDTQYKDATRTFIDQIDIIKLVVDKYSSIFKWAVSASDIEDADRDGRIASLIGVEGGHAIDSSLATLRQLYALGGRYMTLTHTCNTPWAHNSYDLEATEGLNDFGKKVVREMNRLGMLVDISHVNNYTMLDAMETSVAPVIFSHSSAYAICNVSRNVPDNVLEKLKVNKGIVMATFVPEFINCKDPDSATLKDVADHIDHLKLVAGVDHVGIGSDFDGTEKVPRGLEDVSKYPALFAELLSRGYSDQDIEKISRGNFLRVFKAVEDIRDSMKDSVADNTLIEPQPNVTCRTDF